MKFFDIFKKIKKEKFLKSEPTILEQPALLEEETKEIANDSTDENISKESKQKDIIVSVIPTEPINSFSNPLKHEKITVEFSDEIYIEALETFTIQKNVNTTILQRKLKMGYTYAAEIIEELEKKGFIKSYDSFPFKRLVYSSKELEQFHFTVKNSKMEYISVYKNGYLLCTIPPLSDYYNERDKFTHARYIISDDVDYDLEDISSINEILIPDFSQPIITNTHGEFTLGVTGSLEYVLRRKAVELRKRKENYLSITLLKKVCEIMPYSRISWRMNDYMRLVNWLYEDGRFDEADFYEEKFNTMFPVINAIDERHKRDIEKALAQGYDLIKYVNNRSCCLECALRRNRVYSISGNDTRFPKYSEYHCSCYGITIIPFNEEDSKTWSPDYDYIKESNRHFVDDRTDEEKERYQFDCDRKVYEEILERDKKLFNKMKAIIPDFPFKSFRSYRSSSKEKIKEYAKIAINYEMNILPTEEEEEIIERYLKTKKEKGW